MLISRRTFLAGIAAAGAAPLSATADSQVPAEPASDPRYLSYMRPGVFIETNNPVIFQLPANGRKLMAWFPRTAKEARIAVFSHGALSDPLAYSLLLSHWASHGFAVIAPIHRDSIQTGGYKARSVEAGETAEWQIMKILNDPAAWADRVKDCAAALENAHYISKILKIGINTERPIVIGHDFGAFVSQLMIGVRPEMPDHSPAQMMADDRVFASLNLSPQGAGVMGLTPRSWDGASRPFLSITGAIDADPTTQTPQQKSEGYYRAPPGNKHLAYFRNGSHTMYTGQRALTNEAERTAFIDVKAITTAFLKAYGDYNQEAFADVSSKFFDIASSGRMSVLYR